jgi:hypothetical protein
MVKIKLIKINDLDHNVKKKKKVIEIIKCLKRFLWNRLIWFFFFSLFIPLFLDLDGHKID